MSAFTAGEGAPLFPGRARQRGLQALEGHPRRVEVVVLRPVRVARPPVHDAVVAPLELLGDIGVRNLSDPERRAEPG